MTRLLVVLLAAALAAPAAAQDAPPPPASPPEIDVSGVAGLLSDKLKEVKGAALVTWAGKPGAAGYLPIWTWHTADKTPIAEFPTIGYRGVEGRRPDAFTTVTFNLPGLSAKLFGSTWMTNHVTKSKFPPVFFGPAALIPFNVRELQQLQLKNDWTRYLAIVVSVRVAPKPLNP